MAVFSPHINEEWETCVRFAERPAAVAQSNLHWLKNVWTRRTQWQLASLPMHITTRIMGYSKIFRERSSCGHKRCIMAIWIRISDLDFCTMLGVVSSGTRLRPSTTGSTQRFRAIQIQD